jgi:ArsR family transcriptional regulator
VRRQATTTARAGKRKAAEAAPPLPVSDALLEDLKNLFKLLADESRLRIVLALAQEGKMHVSALCQRLGCPSQPAVSHHLTLMRSLGLVDFNRSGRHNYYHLASGYFRRLLGQLFTPAGGGLRTLQLDDFVLTLKHK